MRIVLSMIFIVLGLTKTAAQVKLASPYTNNMVIRQLSEVPIWGWADANKEIKIIASWALQDTLTVRSNSMGEWKAILSTPAADLKPHTIDCNGTVINNVLLGEVWLCSGQSNMVWSVNSRIIDGEKHAREANYPFIRILHVEKRGSVYPQDMLDANWVICNPETMRKASAIGYFFSKELHNKLKVPIGFIFSAWGGTPAETWIPREMFTTEMLENKINLKSPYRPNEPAVLFNRMIHPIVPFSLSGTIWYQGEANVPKARFYDELMRKLISSWRAYFNNKELPFYFVQIAPFNYSNNRNTAAAELREAQEKTSELENTGMVVISDVVPNVRDIHPKDKLTVGVRLANFALAEVYNQDIQHYKSPTYKKVEFRGKKAIIEFSNSSSQLLCKGKDIVGFTIAAKDKKFVKATAKIKADKIEVWADGVKDPVAVRYCFDDTTCGNLTSGVGLPVAPFRTDHKVY